MENNESLNLAKTLLSLAKSTADDSNAANSLEKMISQYQATLGAEPEKSATNESPSLKIEDDEPEKLDVQPKPFSFSLPTLEENTMPYALPFLNSQSKYSE